MTEALSIVIPTEADLPPDMRQAARPVQLKPRVMEVDSKDLPRVLGWNVLVLPVAVPKETEGGIQLAPDSIRHMNLSRRVGVVMAKGPLAYSAKRGFPEDYDAPQVGDWVHIHENSGVDTLMRGKDGEMVQIKYIPDAEIMGVLENPDAFMVMV